MRDGVRVHFGIREFIDDFGALVGIRIRYKLANAVWLW